MKCFFLLRYYCYLNYYREFAAIFHERNVLLANCTASVLYNISIKYITLLNLHINTLNNGELSKPLQQKGKPHAQAQPLKPPAGIPVWPSRLAYLYISSLISWYSWYAMCAKLWFISVLYGHFLLFVMVLKNCII